MQIQPLTLGQALATLAVEKQAAAGFAANGTRLLTATENDYLSALRQRLRVLESSYSAGASDQALPERCCDAAAPFLANNKDFFLGGIFLQAQATFDDGHDTRFFTHLNDCYWCFDEFCQVMRDYYNRSQELLQARFNPGDN